MAVALAEDKTRNEPQVIVRDDGAASRAASGAVEKAPPRRMVEPAAKPAKAAIVRSQSGDLQPKDLDEGELALQYKATDATDRRPRATSAGASADDAATSMAAPRAAGPGGGAGRPAANATIAGSPPPPPEAPAPMAKAPDSNYAWAKDQHARIAALVKAGNCQQAAPLAVAIKSRDPDYYNSFVATDRVLKPCMQYLTEAADREAEKRPAKAHVTTETK